jgi:hypothetical protein
VLLVRARTALEIIRRTGGGGAPGSVGHQCLPVPGVPTCAYVRHQLPGPSLGHIGQWDMYGRVTRARAPARHASAGLDRLLFSRRRPRRWPHARKWAGGRHNATRCRMNELLPVRQIGSWSGAASTPSASSTACRSTTVHRHRGRLNQPTR